MGSVIPIPSAASPIERILSRFDRDQLEAFVAIAIDLIDIADGDPDLEEPGLEDSFIEHRADGPGCPIADIDQGVEDGAFDPEEDRCEAGDDGCGPHVVHGRVWWGSDHERCGE